MENYRPFVLAWIGGKWHIKNASYWEHVLSNRNAAAMAVLVENQQDEKAFQLWRPAAAVVIRQAIKRGYGTSSG